MLYSKHNMIFHVKNFIKETWLRKGSKKIFFDKLLLNNFPWLWKG